MNWYKLAKFISAQSAVYDYLRSHPVNISSLPKNTLPEGFKLVFVDNGWFVLGPNNFLLVNKEENKQHAISLAKMRIKYIISEFDK